MIVIKKVLRALICFLPWLISGIIFKYDSSYYEMLNIPNFALPPKIISIIWIIIYILISISIYKTSKEKNIFKESDYLYVLITNYLANQLFLYVFFNLKSPFFGFVITTVTLVSSIFLIIETRKLNEKASLYLIPYSIYSIYAFILSLVVYIMNF